MIARRGDGRDHSIIPENMRLKTRFGRMMEMIRRGDTLEEMKEAIPGMDESVYRVLHAIDTGTISQGAPWDQRYHTDLAMSKADERAKVIFALFDEGLTTREVADKAGISLAWAREWRTQWGYERGVTSMRRRA